MIIFLVLYIGPRLSTKLPEWIVRKSLDLLIARREEEERALMEEEEEEEEY